MQYVNEAGASTDQGFRARQQARYARRNIVSQREARRRMVVEAVETVLFGLLFYAFLFVGALWASL